MICRKNGGLLLLLAILAILAACTAPPQSSTSSADGGYYKDDGPGMSPQAIYTPFPMPAPELKNMLPPTCGPTPYLGSGTSPRQANSHSGKPAQHHGMEKIPWPQDRKW